MSTLIRNPTILTESINTFQISSKTVEPIPQSNDHQYYILDEPQSSDMVHDTTLTTQGLHLDGQKMYAGACSNDIIPTTEALEFFTLTFVDVDSPSIMCLKTCIHTH